MFEELDGSAIGPYEHRSSESRRHLCRVFLGKSRKKTSLGAKVLAEHLVRVLRGPGWSRQIWRDLIAAIEFDCPSLARASNVCASENFSALSRTLCKNTARCDYI